MNNQSINDDDNNESIENNGTKNEQQQQESIDESSSTTTTTTNKSNEIIYKEVDYHWFYQKDPENNPNEWQAFSLIDNIELELAFQQSRIDEFIPTNGNRYDVRISDRTRRPVYWNGTISLVSRCSWYYKRENDYRFVPYPEYISVILENTYRDCCLTNDWNFRLDLNEQEFIVFYSNNSVYHYFNNNNSNNKTSAIPTTTPSPTTTANNWSILLTSDPGLQQPRFCYRGTSLIKLEPERNESNNSIKHLIFFIHGIGEFCDLSFRPLKDVVDDFRLITYELLSTHYNFNDERIEVLPITWHQALHTEKLDGRLRLITLSSIQKLRSFTNDTILDALFYTSPIHSKLLLNFIANELNSLYKLFIKRNPYFSGNIALAGHSLGSLILFDLLSCQKSIINDNDNDEDKNLDNKNCDIINYNNNNCDNIEQLNFHPKCLFALGSPLAAFLTVRGYDLSLDFHLPTCQYFFNIFHPYDPVAYRLEPMINSEFAKIKPQLIPHHKGRKRIHLELKESIQRVGNDLKQKLYTGLRGALDSIYVFAKGHQQQQEEQSINNESTTETNDDKDNKQPSTLDEKDDKQQSTNNEKNDKQQSIDEKQTSTTTTTTTAENKSQSLNSSSKSLSQLSINSTTTINDENDDEKRILSLNFGRLNNGRRIDYVLQERPFEIVNDYVFAITSHGYYWFSEDTALLMLRELFNDNNNNTSTSTNTNAN